MLEPCMGFIAWRSPAASSPACESAILGPPFAVSGQLIPLGQTTSYWEATTASAAVHTDLCRQASTVCEVRWCSSPLVVRHVSTLMGVVSEGVLEHLERRREL
jgi:hypothetical protein